MSATKQLKGLFLTTLSVDIRVHRFGNWWPQTSHHHPLTVTIRHLGSVPRNIRHTTIHSVIHSMFEGTSGSWSAYRQTFFPLPLCVLVSQPEFADSPICIELCNQALWHQYNWVSALASWHGDFRQSTWHGDFKQCLSKKGACSLRKDWASTPVRTEPACMRHDSMIHWIQSWNNSIAWHRVKSNPCS